MITLGLSLATLAVPLLICGQTSHAPKDTKMFNVTQLRQPAFRRRQDTNQRRIRDWTDGNQISS